MNKGTVTAFIGIGSNMGNREENINKAIKQLSETVGIKVCAVSKLYNTKPVGYTEQADFLNGAIKIKTTLTPHELLKACQRIEKNLKRERVIRWGPRTIDLDILLYGDCTINDKDLIIPHPRMHERDFVLKPLKDISCEE